MSTRSRADSKSTMAMVALPRRTACSAASLTRLARSAPLMPGVPRATIWRSTSGLIRLSRQWTWRIGRRSSRSGSGTTIWRSKRPGRSRAGSKMSGRLVAPIMTTPSVGSNPSISDSIWLRVCSRSSWPPPSPPSLFAAPPPGAALAHDRVDLLHEDDRRRLLAGGVEEVADPGRPDSHEHLHEVRTADREERHAGLPGHRPGKQRLAGARGPDEQDALWDLGADLLEPGRRLQEVDDLA